MRKTKQEQVLEHLQKYGQITPLEALREYGLYRLSDAIYKLRRKGYHIESVLTAGEDHCGGGVCFSTYRYKEEQA